MVNKNFWMGMLAMALAFGMTVVGCDNGSTNGNSTDAALNGTWVDADGDYFILDNGNFERLLNGIPNNKGIYTTSDNRITCKCTHVYVTEEDNDDKYMFESRWYSEKEMKSIVGNDPDWEALFPFPTYTDTYSVIGDTLTIFYEYEPITYTKLN